MRLVAGYYGGARARNGDSIKCVQQCVVASIKDYVKGVKADLASVTDPLAGVSIVREVDFWEYNYKSVPNAYWTGYFTT